MRYFLLIFLLVNWVVIHNVFARKYDNEDDSQPIGRRHNERLKQSEGNNAQRRQKVDISSKNDKISTKHDRTDVNAKKSQITKKRFDNEKESGRNVFNVRDEQRTESRRGNVRGETKKCNKQEERCAPKVMDTRTQKNIKASQVRKPYLKQGGKKSAKYIPDDTDEDDDEDDDSGVTDEDDDDDDDTDEDEDVTDEDDDGTDEDDDDDNDKSDEDDDNTDEDDTDEDEDDDSFEMITYKDKKKPTFLQRLKGKKGEKPKKQLSYRKKVYKELGLVDDGAKNVSSEEIIVRPKKHINKRSRDCDSMEEDCP